MERDVTTRYPLDGAEMFIGAPVEVGRAGGHLWFPALHRLDDRRILCTATLAEDKGQGEWPSALFLTEDDGVTWRRERDIACYGLGSSRTGPAEMLLQPYEVWPLKPGARRDAAAQGTVIALGPGPELAVRRAEVRFLGFPRDLQDYNVGQLAAFNNGPLLTLPDGRLHATLYGKFVGDELLSLWSFVSGDRGFTWEFQSVIAAGDFVRVPREGPNEADTVLLPDGRLLCVYRALGRTPFWRSLSPDLGRTWGPPVMIESAASVKPQMARLANDLVLLSGGREGLFLWVGSDGTGRAWLRVNLGRHHNAHVAEASRYPEEVVCGAVAYPGRAATTAYTGLIALGGNEALVAYDRLANGWGAAPGPYGVENAIFCARVRVEKNPVQP
jgi:hypothetical protein